MKGLLFVLGLLVLVSPTAMAEEGDPQAGLAFAKEVCSPCHAIASGESPLFEATPFEDVANNPGMTGTALAVWLQTSHPTMPNYILEKQDMLNVVAYILSLKHDNQTH